MRQFVALLALIALVPPATNGADIVVPSDKIKVSLLVGTTNAFTGVAFDIVLADALPGGAQIDRDRFKLSKSQLPRLEIRDAADNFRFELDREEVGAALQKIQMADRSASPELLDPLSNGRNYLFIDAPIRVPLTNGDFLIITPEALKAATLSEITLSEENRKRLLAKKGGAHTLYQNKIDFATRGDRADSTKREFVLTYSYFGTPLENLSWWAFAAKGYLSTNKQDPLTEIKIYPITIGHVYGLDAGQPLKTGEVRIWLGLDGNQSLRRSRLNASFYCTTLFPNFVNLSYGNDRLRLKPVVKLGIEVWDELEDGGIPGDRMTGGKIGGELYYYVPIMKNYSLLIEGEFGYLFGADLKQKYGTPDFINRFDATLGYELPNADLKVIAKYSFGQNDINFERDDKLLLGLAIDILKLGGGSMPSIK